MTAVGWLPADTEDLFGPDATAEESYDLLTVDVPPATWTEALRTARDQLDCRYFDWLSAVDEPGTGFRVAAHVVALAPVRRLLLRTTVPHDAPTLPTAVGVYAGAAWHERETHEMFGVDFTDHPGLDHLLLPETFEGHPLRKDFVLAARVAKAWPGAKEPGESEHGGPKRRQMLPPGVPDPNEWGPLKGRLPPAPTRPARAAGRSATAGTPARPAAGDRPVRRSRTASEGSASQQPATPRRARTASEGSATQRARPPEPTEATEGTRAAETSETPGEAQKTTAPPSDETRPPTPPRSPDAPWHHARPAHEDHHPQDAAPPAPEPKPEAPSTPEPPTPPTAETEATPEPEPTPETTPEPESSAEADPPEGGRQ
ncbi:NADH-quinone oxidoreductase subunit C [Streptomyces sp. NPDC093252]|uniref:NADH-quinone oxidoreductase subunit C n=1 Tax=Streptomyces sp. NPDC093252 TaxID=3154980 RepID=UPI00344A882D